MGSVVRIRLSMVFLHRTPQESTRTFERLDAKMWKTRSACRSEMIASPDASSLVDNHRLRCVMLRSVWRFSRNNRPRRGPASLPRSRRTDLAIRGSPATRPVDPLAEYSNARRWVIAENSERAKCEDISAATRCRIERYLHARCPMSVQTRYRRLPPETRRDKDNSRREIVWISARWPRYRAKP